MKIKITLSDPGLGGSDFNNFNIFSDVDSYASPIDTNVNKLQLISGYTCSTVPEEANTLRIVSADGSCIGMSQSVSLSQLFTQSKIYRNPSSNGKMNATLIIQTSGGEISTPETLIHDGFVAYMTTPTIFIEYESYNINPQGVVSLNITSLEVQGGVNSINWYVDNISFGIKSNGVIVTYTYEPLITIGVTNTVSNPILLNLTRTQI